METDVHFRRDSNADHNRSEHPNKTSKKHKSNNNNNHFNCNKTSKTKDKTFDGQEFNASKDKHQNKNKTQSHREKDNKHKKSSNSVKKDFDNNLTINTNKCNNNKKNNKDKDKDHSKDNSTTTSNHKINKNKDNHLKTNKDVINNNKSLNELLDNNKSLSNRETSLDTNQKNSCLVVKEFKFFKEKAKKKNISEQKAATSKSTKVATGSNSSNSCGTTSCKQVLKSCDVLSISSVSDGSAKHKSKSIGNKETKQSRDGSISLCSSSTLYSGGCSATSSANISCDSKTNKLKTSGKTNKSSINTKYSQSSDQSKYIHNCSEYKKNSQQNKTIIQSSKTIKNNKNSVVESNDKCPKNETKKKNKVNQNLIKDNPLYDEDIIDGFAIFSFKCLDDIELTINGRTVPKKKKDKSKKEDKSESSLESIASTISSVSSGSSTVSPQLKCYNKSNENKSSKLSANKHLKNGSKDLKNSNNKSDTKNRVDSKVTKCSKKAKQTENNGNNNNNNNNHKNKNVDNNNEQQKTNNSVVNSVNSSKSQSLESSTVLTVNKKTSINANKPEVSINKRESRTEEDLKEVQTNAILDKSVSEDTKSISLTTSVSLLTPSHLKSPSCSLNSSTNSSISDSDKSLIVKNRSSLTVNPTCSVSNDSSLSSPSASSTTLPLNSSDGESDGQLSDCHNIKNNVKNECESNSSNTCSLSKAPIITTKSNTLLTPPPLPTISSSVSDSSSTQNSEQSAPQQLCGSDVSKHFELNHKSSDHLETTVNPICESKDKSVNGFERTFQSHFIESVLRNTSPPEESNVRKIGENTTVSTNHCPPSSPLINKYENNNKENNLSSLGKVCAKNPKQPPNSTSDSNFSDNNSHNYSSNASNCIKTAINETIPQSHGLGVKRPSSPVPSNQSIASKQIRYSSPNNQTNCLDSHNSVPQQSVSISNRSTSNSLSSLSQLSQSIGQNLSSSKEREDRKDREREDRKEREREDRKEREREDRKEREREDRKDREREDRKDREREEPSKGTATSRNTPLTTNTSPVNTFTPNYSIPKSQLWSTSSSASNGSAVSTVRHLSSPSLAPRPTTPSIGLSSSLHNNHLSMFASPIPPVSLPSVGGAVAPSATPSPFIGDSLFSHQNQDFLRRELDTRFLASQDRTINIPPPPYMRPELHPHIHLTQNQSFPLTPAIGNPLMPTSNPQMFEKYPKLDQPFYGRNALGLPGFPSLSPLLSANNSSTVPQTSSLTSSTNTPFGSPGHSAAFQPKLNSLSSKSKPSAKSGRWCAMHVRIAWEIYHHQQKQHMDLSHKTSVSSATGGQTKGGADMLRPLNHLFSLGSQRPQELPPFSSALLSAASSRAPFESPLPSHHSQPFGSAPASPHLSSQTTNFPRFPTFGGYGSLNSSLSLPPVAGPPNPSSNLFGPTAITGTRDLPIPGCLPGLSASGPDIWSRSANTRPTSALFPPLTASTSSTSSSSSSSWGGLKAEAERNRINDELFNKRKASENLEKEAKRFEREHKSRSDDRLEAKHRDQSHSSLKHNSNNSSHLRNGDIYSDNKNKDWMRSSHKRDTSRSPVHQSHHSHSHSSHHSHHSSSHSHHNTHSHIHSQSSLKSGNPDMSAFDNNKLNSIGVKDEQKDDLHSLSERERISRFSNDSNEQKVKNSVIPTATSTANLLTSSQSLAAMGLNNQLEKARIMGLFGLQGTPPPMSPHFNANNPSDPLRAYWNPLMASVDPFKNLHDFQVRPDFLDRDNIFQRYSLLNSSGGGASLMERLAKESAEKEMLSHSIEKHNSKLMASHMRSNDTSFTSGLPIHPPHTPHTPHMPPSQVSTPSSLSSNIFPANPYLNSLHSLSASAGSYVKNNKVSSALHTSSSSTSSSEPSSPSLAPTNGNLPALIPNVLNHSIHSSNLTNSKLSIGSLIDSPLESMKDITNKTNDTNSTSMGGLVIPNGNNNSVDVLETNSR